MLGLAEYLSENYERAIESINQIDKPLTRDFACLAASYAQLNRTDDAETAVDEFLKLFGRDSMIRDEWLSFWLEEFDFKDEKPVAHLIEGLEKAGLVSG